MDDYERADLQSVCCSARLSPLQIIAVVFLLWHFCEIHRLDPNRLYIISVDDSTAAEPYFHSIAVRSLSLLLLNYAFHEPMVHR